MSKKKVDSLKRDKDKISKALPNKTNKASPLNCTGNPPTASSPNLVSTSHA